MLAHPATDDRIIWDTWLSSLHMPAVIAAEACGVFAMLADGPADEAALAARGGLDRRTLEIVSPLLCALGFLDRRSGALHLKPAAREFLLADSSYYWGHVFAFERPRSPQANAILARLKGLPPPAPVLLEGEARVAVEAWEQARLEAEQARRIAAFMHSQSMPAVTGAARFLDLSGVARLLDVGGGSGCFSVGFARANPALRCTVMELEAMCVAAQEYIASGVVADRVDTIAVDMFREAWPRGYDAALLSNIFHDWAEDTCIALAGSAFAALPSGGRILLHEQLLNEDRTGPLTVAAFSVLMLLGTRGRQYTFGELRGFLELAGFRDVAAAPTYAYYSVVSAVKP